MRRLRQDHGWLEEDWLELRAPARLRWRRASHAVDRAVLREGVEIFVALSRDHVTLEESFIYPQARALLREPERRDMGRQMAARRRRARPALIGVCAPVTFRRLTHSGPATMAR